MTAPPFDGSEYRRTVLTPLRTVAPAGIDDVFWLGHVPREIDDEALIAARLKSAKAFLHKERSRPRQADVAAAVLREWPRVEGVLADPAARGALRARLGNAAPGAAAVGAGATGTAAAADAPAAGLDPAARRRRQVATALGELARLREEPELAEDLFAFLGLPVTSTEQMLRARVEKVGEVNRRRRPDRERSLVDELLMHSRELLVDGDPAAYRAALAADAAGVAGPLAPPAAADPVAPPVQAPEQPEPVPEVLQVELPNAADAPGSPDGASAESGPPRIDYTRRRPPGAARPPVVPPAAEAPPTESSSSPAEGAPAVVALAATRDPGGALRLTWTWPPGVTEVFVVVGEPVDPESAVSPSRKFTNTKYGLDGGAVLDGVSPGTNLTVLSGRRDASGRLSWSSPAHAPATIAP
ncbi:MAG: hypothetical protein JHD16_01380 [Solirubrobacteraceae bacterium]|nr:hypothetical protein [Solirubrobacteraceae bacterium]